MAMWLRGFVAMGVRGCLTMRLCSYVAEIFCGVLLEEVTNANKIEVAICFNS